MERVAIVEPLRTPVGRFGGAFKGVPVEDLAAGVVRALLERTAIDPERVEEVVLAQSYANSETPCIGRWVAQHAGLPEHVAGQQVDRRCGGGVQAVVTAAMMVATGAAEIVVAGGAESMSRIEHYSTDVRWGRRSGSVTMHDRLDRGRLRAQPEWRYGEIPSMIATAETLAREYGISRERSDAFAVRSHQRAAAAASEGRFDEEIVPVRVRTRAGETVVTADEGIRADADASSLARLRALEDGGVVTAGNASQQSDAAAACLVMTEGTAAALGLEPIAFVEDWVAVGCDPARMGLGPVPALERLSSRTGRAIGEYDLVELNEAFAPQVLAVLDEWGWDGDDRLNVNGGGISLGHPIGATGARMIATGAREMKRRQARTCLVTMCIGGGQGIALSLVRD